MEPVAGAVDATRINAFKSKLHRLRYTRMAFFMDQSAESIGLLVESLLARPHEVCKVRIYTVSHKTSSNSVKQKGCHIRIILLPFCHVLAALSCYRLSHRDSTFANWTAEQHLHDRCGLRDRTCVGPRRVSSLPGPVRAER